MDLFCLPKDDCKDTLEVWQSSRHVSQDVATLEVSRSCGNSVTTHADGFLELAELGIYGQQVVGLWTGSIGFHSSFGGLPWTIIYYHIQEYTLINNMVVSQNKGTPI